MKKHNTEPLWRSVRGVGLPPAHKYTHDMDLPLHNRARLEAELDRIQDLQLGPSQHMPVPTPNCQRCCLPASAEHYPHNRWWCLHCWEEVHAPMHPNAMVPGYLSTTTTFEPTISDPTGSETCHKCARTFRPRIDNTGWTCPSCGETHLPAPAPRYSPSNGF